MSTKKRPDGGKKSSGKLRPEYLDVRLGIAEKQAFKEAADLAGLPLSTWVRDRLRQSARRELIEGGCLVPFLQQEA